MTYRYNPACVCDWCANQGHPPQGTPSNGHSFGYGNEHVPPHSRPWTDRHKIRLVALLSFYNESPAWLDRCVRSLHLLPAQGIIALDGAYSLFPDAKATSPPDQRAAIRTAAAATETPLIIESPEEPWPGEVEKRNHLFHIAETTGADWYFVIDSDEYVTEAPPDLHERLHRSPFDVGATELLEPTEHGPILYPTHPKFFRAIPGLRAVHDHFTYTTPDGRRLWGDQRRHRLEARDDLTSVKVTHARNLRHSDRRQAADKYYADRDAAGIEDLPAERHKTTA